MIEISVYASSSTGNLYSIDDSETKVLIECGLPIQKIKKTLNFNLSNYSGCLLTHGHLDHARSAKDIMSVGIDLFCSLETATSLKLSGHRLHIIQPLKQFKVGSFTVLPFDGIHDVPILNFLIMNEQKERFLFLIDTAYCKYYFKNLNLIMIGINYDSDMLRENIKSGRLNPALGRRIMQNHFSLRTALEFLKINVCKHTKAIYPIHVSEKNADKDRIREAVQRQTGKLVLI